jgi:hypothetical protein
MTAEELRCRFPMASESFIINNADGSGGKRPADTGEMAEKPAVSANFQSRPTTTEQRLNKLEKSRLQYLRMLKVPNLRVQSFTLRLAEDTRLTPDFSYLDENGRMVFEDTKGKHTWEDALIKLRVASRIYNEFRFLIVKRDETGGWITKEISP